MTRREIWITVAVIALVALVARIAAASTVVFPIPEDTAYYFGVARNLVDGQGLVSNALWSFQTPPLEVPGAAFEVWLPLPSLLAAIPMSIFGPTFRAAQVMPVAAGTIIPILTWRLAWDVAMERHLPLNRARVVSIGAGLTAAVELPLVLHSTLPDSTALFAVFALSACLLMARLAADPRGGRLTDPRLIALGVVIGIAAWTRNEAVWLGLAWVVVVLWRGGTATARGTALRMVVVPGVIAVLVFVPWAIRDWMAFGSPLPGQALTNAFSLTGFDIFAFQDPPTLSRYLAAGPAALLQDRVDGFTHNLFDVLLLPSFPVGIIGLATLPWFGRGHALRPLLVFSVLTFAVTTLVFPVATTWGTYLHASEATQVLLIVGCLFALDEAIVRIGRRRAWTNPVAWLGPALTLFVSAVFLVIFLPGFGQQSRDIAERYTALDAQLTAIGHPVATLGPVISDFPIWFAEGERAPALALPDEPPSSILALARAFPGTHYLIMTSDPHGRWPAVLQTSDPNAACFKPVDLGVPSDPVAAKALSTMLMYELVCP